MSLDLDDTIVACHFSRNVSIINSKAVRHCQFQDNLFIEVKQAAKVS